MRATLRLSSARPRGEHDHHRQEEDHVREVGQQRLAEGVDESNDDAAQECAAEAPHGRADTIDQVGCSGGRHGLESAKKGFSVLNTVPRKMLTIAAARLTSTR